MIYNKHTNYPKKQRHEIPPPEEIKVDTPIALTININLNDDTSNTLTLHPYYQAALQRISEYAEVDMYYEYSSSMKLHMHGFIRVVHTSHILPLYLVLNDPKFKDRFTYCLKMIFDKHRDDGDIEDGHANWLSYCTKQKHLTKPYLRKMDINYHTQICEHHPIGQIYKYISPQDELYKQLSDFQE